MPEHFTALSAACTDMEVRAAVENSAAAAAAKVAAVTVFFMVMMVSFRASPFFLVVEQGSMQISTRPVRSRCRVIESYVAGVKVDAPRLENLTGSAKTL
ncbi:hypothetical protein HHA02_24220 [Cobetia marina]|nr:hypothetical protein HHA02_24220 [Cobetia marina]